MTSPSTSRARRTNRRRRSPPRARSCTPRSPWPPARRRPEARGPGRAWPHGRPSDRRRRAVAEGGLAAARSELTGSNCRSRDEAVATARGPRAVSRSARRGPSLDDDVAQGQASTGPATIGTLARSGGQPAEQVVRRARHRPRDDLDHVPPARRPPRLSGRRRWPASRGCSGSSWPGSCRPDPPGHVAEQLPGRRRRPPGPPDGGCGLRQRASRSVRPQVRMDSWRSHSPPTSSKELDPACPPRLVGEVRRPRRSADRPVPPARGRPATTPQAT